MFDDYSQNLIIAQENEPFTMPGEAGAPADGAASGAPGGAPAGPPPLGGNNFFLVIFLVLGAMIIFSMMGQRRDRKKRDVMLNALKKHDKVQTIGGVVGSIVDVKKDVVVLKVDESTNARLTVARSAIQQVLSVGAGGPANAPAGTAATASEKT